MIGIKKLHIPNTIAHQIVNQITQMQAFPLYASLLTMSILNLKLPIVVSELIINFLNFHYNSNLFALTLVYRKKKRFWDKNLNLSHLRAKR